MLGRLHRFHGRTTLAAVYRRSETVRGQQLSLKYARHSDGPYRVAVVVSRKVSKSAVVRNRIRRRVYEIVRQKGDQIPAGTELLFTAFSDQLAEIEPAKLQAMVTGLLEKAVNLGPTTAANHGIVNPKEDT